jgi:hypothetical protein
MISYQEYLEFQTWSSVNFSRIKKMATTAANKESDNG